MSRPIEQTYTILGEEITVYRIDNDYYGNPRYVAHFLSLGMPSYEDRTIANRLGWSKYRGRWFGGGLVTQSYSIERDLEQIITAYQEAGAPYLVHRHDGGYGVWANEFGWRDCEPLELFPTASQARDYINRRLVP